MYKALDTRLKRTVAVKLLLERGGADPASPEVRSQVERRRRFAQEARAVSALNHPHICVLYDVGSQDGTDYLVMEHLDGQTLAERLTTGPLPLAQALDVAIQTADALAVAHRAGIVHRDLKPSNVMLVKAAGGGLSAKLLDFGLARLTTVEPTSGPTATHSAVGVVAGTVPYMAPEQVEGRATDARTDLFAFGAVLYEMLTGTRAFDGASPASVAAAILEHEPPPLDRVLPLTPPALNRLLARCLAKDPEARWQSASDLAEALRWVRESDRGGRATGAGTAAPVPYRVARWTVVAIAAALLIVVGGVAVLWRLRPPADSSQAPKGLSLDLYEADALNSYGPFLPYAVGGSRTAMVWTPDGGAFVFVGWRGSARHLFMRRLDAVAVPIKGTQSAHAPAISPDGRWVAFWSKKTIRKVALGGGPALDLGTGCGVPAEGNGLGRAGPAVLRTRRWQNLDDRRRGRLDTRDNRGRG